MSSRPLSAKLVIAFVNDVDMLCQISVDYLAKAAMFEGRVLGSHVVVNSLSEIRKAYNYHGAFTLPLLEFDQIFNVREDIFFLVNILLP